MSPTLDMLRPLVKLDVETHTDDDTDYFSSLFSLQEGTSGMKNKNTCFLCILHKNLRYYIKILVQLITKSDIK